MRVRTAALLGLVALAALEARAHVGDRTPSGFDVYPLTECERSSRGAGVAHGGPGGRDPVAAAGGRPRGGRPHVGRMAQGPGRVAGDPSVSAGAAPPQAAGRRLKEARRHGGTNSRKEYGENGSAAQGRPDGERQETGMAGKRARLERALAYQAVKAFEAEERAQTLEVEKRWSCRTR